MKDQVRVLGIDDAPFLFDDEKVPIVGALVRLPNYLEAVIRSEVTIDGSDSTDVIAEMIISSRYREQVKLILIDGIALGGFNIVDVSRLHSLTGIPVATVTRDEPDMERIERALKAHFPDWEHRLELIRRTKLVTVATEHSPIYVSMTGIELYELLSILRSCTVQGVLPEPIRIAHLIGTAIVRGESKGDA